MDGGGCMGVGVGVGGMGVRWWVWDGKVWVWPVREGISATEAGEPGGMIVWRRIADILKKLIEQAR